MFAIEEEEKIGGRRSSKEEEVEEEEKEAREVILLVDDQPMNIEVLRMLLTKKLNKEVEFYYSGHDAIQGLNNIIRQHRLGRRSLRLLVLMDVNMPVMDGIETTLRMKELLETTWNI